MRQIGINMQAIRGLNDEEYVKQVKDLGFDAIFTGTAPTPQRHEVFANLFAKYGLVYETLHAPFGHINDIWLDCEGGEKMYEELITCIDHCVISGVKIAVTHLSSGLTPPPVTDLGRARFTKVVEYAQKKGVIIAFENQRFLSNIAWAFETFKPEDSVAFCWDCGHESCFTPGREYMPLYGDRLVCTHIHDNSGVFNADNHLIPFEGQINYNRFAEHIRKAGYTGSLMLEVGCDPKQYAGVTPEDFLARAAKAVKKLREMVDGN